MGNYEGYIQGSNKGPHMTRVLKPVQYGEQSNWVLTVLTLGYPPIHLPGIAALLEQ